MNRWGTVRRAAAFAAGVCVAVAATACAPHLGRDAAPSPAAADRSGAQYLPSPVHGSLASHAAARVPVTGGHGRCVDTSSPAVVAAVAGLGRAPLSGRPYVASAATSAPVGSCPDVMWVLARPSGATAGSPYRLLFFDRSGALRPTSGPATVYTTVVGSTGGSVSVQYRWLVAGDSSCCPSGGPVVVHYVLSGGTVRADRPVPTQAYAGAAPVPRQSVSTTTPRPVATTRRPATRAAAPCASASAQALADVAASSAVGARLVSPIAFASVRCDIDWALAYAGPRGDTAQPAYVLFRHTAAGWRAVVAGSAIGCSQLGVPEGIAGRIGCG